MWVSSMILEYVNYNPCAPRIIKFQVESYYRNYEQESLFIPILSPENTIYIIENTSTIHTIHTSIIHHLYQFFLIFQVSFHEGKIVEAPTCSKYRMVHNHAAESCYENFSSFNVLPQLHCEHLIACPTTIHVSNCFGPMLCAHPTHQVHQYT